MNLRTHHHRGPSYEMEIVAHLDGHRLRELELMIVGGRRAHRRRNDSTETVATQARLDELLASARAQTEAPVFLLQIGVSNTRLDEETWLRHARRGAGLK